MYNIVLFLVCIIIYFVSPAKIGFLSYAGKISENNLQEILFGEMKNITNRENYQFEIIGKEIASEIDISSVFEEFNQIGVKYIFGIFYNGLNKIKVEDINSLAKLNNMLVFYLEDIDNNYCHSNIITAYSFYSIISTVGFFNIHFSHYGIGYYDPNLFRSNIFSQYMNYLIESDKIVVIFSTEIKNDDDVIAEVLGREESTPIYVCLDNIKYGTFKKLYEDKGIDSNKYPIIIVDCMTYFEAEETTQTTTENKYYLMSSISKEEIEKQEEFMPLDEISWEFIALYFIF